MPPTIAASMTGPDRPGPVRRGRHDLDCAVETFAPFAERARFLKCGLDGNVVDPGVENFSEIVGGRQRRINRCIAHGFFQGSFHLLTVDDKRHRDCMRV